MEQQTFSKHGLERAIRKSDFLRIPKGDQEAYREKLLMDSLLAAKTKFSGLNNPLSSFTLKRNLVFKLGKHSDRVVERKLTINLRRAFGVRVVSRSATIENLKLFLREGVPFRIYRLDVQKFYESFLKDEIEKKMAANFRLSPQSKSLLASLLEKHSQIGGIGTPRGLPISSVITEIMMSRFDLKIRNNIDTFFYSRYVDDIIVITSGNEDSKSFLEYIENSLPKGLTLNPKKLEISSKVPPLSLVKVTAPKAIVARFEYLGYRFTVSNPKKKSENEKHRVIEVDIAEKKSNKYKLRMSRSFYDFSITKDWALLRDRIRYLSNNFRVFNPYIGKTKLAGIYHNYPALQPEAKNLIGLDYFLRGLVLSRGRRLGKLVTPLLTAPMKRELLSNSFIKGHTEKKFIHFSSKRINEIKKCWER